MSILHKLKTGTRTLEGELEVGEGGGACRYIENLQQLDCRCTRNKYILT